MNQEQQHQQQQNTNSGLTRYRSAPSSYFSNLINSGMYQEEALDPFFNPETERILSRFVSVGSEGDNLSSQRNHNRIQQNEFLVSIHQNNHVHSQELVHDNNSVVSSSILVRQSSSPAGFFEHNGYHMMKSMDAFQPVNGSVPDSSFSLASRSSSRLLSIPEQEGKSMACVASFPSGSWDESSMLTDRFLNEFVDSDQISSSENQNDDGRIQSVHVSTGLTHQLSLPTGSNELSAMEKLSRVQDNVPLRSRAKRGCATHPRSIAERVRRTRISERIRKLQDLVPNMDNQTSTADMLDLAVDYIKELQNQVETLSDRRTKCTCQNKLNL